MLHLMHPSHTQLEVPWALAHRPIEERRKEKGSTLTASQVGLLDFMADWLSSQETLLHGHRDPSQRLHTLATHLVELAQTPPRDLLDLINRRAIRLRASRLRRQRSVMEESAATPPGWQADLRDIVAANGAALTEPSTYFQDLPRAALDAPPAFGHPGFFWQRFGVALAAWEDIRDAATDARLAAGLQ
jgi:hypothetical protein